MNRKIAACFLAGILSITAVPVPAAAQEAVSGKNVSEEPLDAIRAQEIAMEKQEELEEEENMPAEEPDPLVLDEDGKVVPASAASWTEETQEPENAKTADAALPDDFSDGNPDGNTEEISDAPTDGDKPETEEESLETEEEGTGTLSENDEGTELVPEQNAMEDTQDEIQLEDGAENVTEGENTTGELSDNAEEETFTSEEADRFSDGSASEGELGTYQTVTLEIEDGQDITAPLNTLFLQLKEQVSDETPCKIIIPPGNYKLTGTLCMYSNMYLYAKGATITKTSPTKHLILRLGNTKESEGEYEGYRNVIIDGGTWDFNYQCVAEKDEPGGFVGFCIGHATNVTIKNATFLNNLKSHFLEFGGVKNAKITGCTFHGYYKNYVKGGQECIQIDCCTDEDNVFPQYMPYDGSTCEDFVIDGNVFEDVFAGVGTHSMMAGKTYKRITVTNNTFHNVKKRCIEFLNYEDSTAENNTMVNVGLGVEVSAVNKKNTHLTQGYSGEPDVKKNRNIRVAGNYVSLAKTSSIGGIAWICSGVKVIGYNMKNSGEVIPEGMTALMIPNKEIKEIFEATIIKWFDDSARTWNREKLFDAVWTGKSEIVTKEMTKLLRKTISYNDYKEDFYHAFLAGIFAGAGYTVDSNKEHGEGRSDVVVYDPVEARVAVFEAKYSKKLENMEKDCDRSIQQINTRMYAEEFEDDYDEIFCYGISFFKKRSLVKKKG